MSIWPEWIWSIAKRRTIGATAWISIWPIWSKRIYSVKRDKPPIASRALASNGARARFFVSFSVSYFGLSSFDIMISWYQKMKGREGRVVPFYRFLRYFWSAQSGDMSWILNWGEPGGGMWKGKKRRGKGVFGWNESRSGGHSSEASIPFWQASARCGEAFTGQPDDVHYDIMISWYQNRTEKKSGFRAVI